MVPAGLAAEPAKLTVLVRFSRRTWKRIVLQKPAGLEVRCTISNHHVYRHTLHAHTQAP